MWVECSETQHRFCHPWRLDSGNPCRNDGVGAGRLHHLVVVIFEVYESRESDSC